MRWFLLLALSLGACNTADQPAMTSAATASDWVIEITTSGGITGRGLGSVTITPSEATTTDVARRACTAALTDEERSSLATLAANAKPAAWRDQEPPSGSADLIEYTLTLPRGTESHHATWSGEDVSGLPKDLGTLFTNAWRVRGRVMQTCR